MWAMILLAIVSSSCINIGKALQKQAADSLPTFSWNLSILKQYLQCSLWVLGMVSDIGGGLLTAVALGKAPVSVVQPVQSLGLVVLAVFSHFYLKETLEFHQLVSGALCLIGTIGLGTSSDASSSKTPSLIPLRVLGTLLCFAAALGCSTLWRKKSAASRGIASDMHGVKVDNTLCGLEAGGYFGLSAACTRTGFLFSGKSILFVPMGMVGSILLTGIGFTIMTQGYKGGNTVTICTFANVAAMVAGVLVGLVALGEQMPSSRGLWYLRLASWVILGLGVASSSPGGLRKAQKSVKSLLVAAFLFPGRIKVYMRKFARQTKEKVSAIDSDLIPDV